MRRLTVSLMTAMACLVVGGCAQQSTQTSSTTAVSAAEEALAAREAELSSREARLRDAQSQLQQDRDSMSSASSNSASMSSASSGDGSLFPPNPRPGECYARVIIPAKYDTSTERVLKRDASERIEVTPATYTSGEETVIVREASTKLEIVPAEYEVVQERVMVKPASKKIVEVPAKYESKTDRILDKPAHTVWKRGTDVTGSASAVTTKASIREFVNRTGSTKVVETRVDDTGEIMCLVEVPATYRTVTKQVLVSPGTTKVVEIPAEYKTVKKRVVKRPATTREVQIPAEYSTVKVTKIAAPAKERRIPIPAEYEVVSKSKKVADESIEWRPVLCQVNMTADNIQKLQTALKSEGCYECRIDGQMGPCTYRASQCYAKRKGLPAGSNYVTTQVIKSLGVTLD